MMKAKVKILYILTFAFFLKSESQNIVPNYSFENFKECTDTSFLSFYSLLDSTWYQYNSADYFNTCDTTFYLGAPKNRFGHQYAYSGNAYVGLNAYVSGGFGREFIWVVLNNALTPGQTYYVNFYVSLADSALYAIKNIGALFTDFVFPFPSSTQSITPQIEATILLSDKANWVQISGSFIAVGGEQYLTIGNFRNDANTVKQYVGTGGGAVNQHAYYYIDDVYVGETPLGIKDIEKEKPMHLYPNPNNGEMALEYNIEQDGELQIRDIMGKLVAVYKLSSKNSILKINDINLVNGVYSYSIVVNKTKLIGDKFILLK